MKPKNKPWYQIKAAAEKSGPAQVYIYEDIDPYWGTNAHTFAIELDALDVEEIDVHINSAGGNIFEGYAIANAIRNHKATVTAYIDGLAASIASVIALAADKVVIAPAAMFMYHEATGAAYRAKASDMRRVAAIIDQMNETIAQIYADKTGKTTTEIRAEMAAETWLKAPAAIEQGFCDELGPAIAVAACADAETFQALGFSHVPDELLAVIEPSAPEAPEPPAPDAGDTAPTIDNERLAAQLRTRFKEV